MEGDEHGFPTTATIIAVFSHSVTTQLSANRAYLPVVALIVRLQLKLLITKTGN